jgi:lambda repressor-like predicted transcriptional regulator
MHPEDIKAELRKAGSSQTRIARTLKVSHTTVAHVIHGRTKSRRIALEIARVTGKSLDDLWPGRYPPKNDDTTGGHQ